MAFGLDDAALEKIMAAAAATRGDDEDDDDGTYGMAYSQVDLPPNLPARDDEDEDEEPTSLPEASLVSKVAALSTADASCGGPSFVVSEPTFVVSGTANAEISSPRFHSALLSRPISRQEAAGLLHELSEYLNLPVPVVSSDCAGGDGEPGDGMAYGFVELPVKLPPQRQQQQESDREYI